MREYRPISRQFAANLDGVIEAERPHPGYGPGWSLTLSPSTFLFVAAFYLILGFSFFFTTSDLDPCGHQI
jgi:hypothetical protein